MFGLGSFPYETLASMNALKLRIVVVIIGCLHDSAHINWHPSLVRVRNESSRLTNESSKFGAVVLITLSANSVDSMSRCS